MIGRLAVCLIRQLENETYYRQNLLSKKKVF